MKVKTFILTFLMMMSSMFLFGQNVLPGGYNMTITSKIILDGDLQTNTDYLVYAMHDGTVLGQSSIMQEGPDEYITEPLYYVSLEVEGNSGDVINFKLVADGKTYISSTEVNYVDNAMLGNLEDLYTIEFKSVAQIGNVVYPSLQEAFAAAAQTEELTTIELLPVTIEEDDDINTVEKTIKLPATLKNVIVKGADNNTSILKNLTIQNAQGGTYDMSNITFDGVVFDNSNIVLTGWRTGFESLKNLIVKNCVFRNIVRSSANLAAVHINVAADKAVNGFTFINNVIDGVTGAQNSGIYGQFTGEVIVKDNTINNVAFRPYVIQLTTDDGIADNFTVTGNTFSGSAAGRAQGLGNNAEGTDAVTLTVSNNIFKGITAAQQICYWNFNEATTTATLEKNYYGIDVMANPNRIYYNSAAQNITDLSEMGIFPIYTELKEDGTINEESLFNPVAYVGTVAYEALAEAFACQGGTIVLLEDIELTEGVVVAADKTFTLDLNGKVVSGVSTTAASSSVITNNGNLTVQSSVEGGKITSFANNPDQNGTPAYANNTITNCGVLTLVSGTIENSTVQGLACYPIDNNSTLRDAIVNIQGGVVTGRGAIRQFANSETNKNEVNVTGGQVIGTSYAIWIQNPSNQNSKDVKAALNISDGELGKILLEASAAYDIEISGGKISEVTFWETDDTNPERNASAFITGGTFDGDVSAYCAFGYTCQANGDGTYGIVETTSFEIPNLDRLIAFRNAVNAGNTFAGQTVTVTDNINMESVENWTPIGTLENPFNGTFDGGNKTISNLNVNGGAYVGLFGYADNATIKNVKINNANVKGTNCVGVIAGDVYSTSLIDNCHVSGSIKVEGQTNVGGIVGKYYTKVTNSSVIGDGVATSYVKGVHYAADYEGDNIGGIMGHGGENNTFTNNTVKNITISGTRKVGGIVGVTDQNTDVTNCLVENVNIETTATAEYASANAAKAGHASIVGSYTKLGTNNNGTVTNCVVKNVTFVNKGAVAVSFGPITGGAREGMIYPTGVTASGNLIYMSTISDNTTNTYLMKAVAKIEETNYYTLDEAIAEANNQTVTVLENVTLRNTLTIEAGKVVTLDLNGQTINTAWEDESAEKHYYAFDNKGTLTITDSSTEANGVINARGNFNYGTLTLEKGTINAIDHNGGYGVRNYGGSKFTMKGGLIATTNENGDDPVSGAYDATTVRVDYDAEFIMNGGNIDNISNFTIAIENYGTTTINEDAGEVKSVHTTLANHGTMTINGGTFICDGLEGITAHALWATPGSTTTINGGTFNGKDNYNGFNVDASAGAVVEINGGNFKSVHSGSLYGDGTITVKGGTFFDEVAEERLADGYVCKENADGTYGVFLGVAKIVETDVIYASLQAAVNAATTSQNIVLLADINETFTILKKVTIDGDSHNSTGLISTNSGAVLTFKNFNVEGGSSYFLKPNGGGGDYVIENVTVKGGSGLLYGNKSTDQVNVNSVNIKNATYGAGRFVSVNDVILKEVNITSCKYGVNIRNNASRTVKFIDCDINAIYPMYIDEQGTYTITFKFEGETNVNNVALNTGTYYKYVLSAVGAKLVNAQEGLNITTSVEGCYVEYEAGETEGFGTYSVVAANVALYRAGDLVKQFATLQEAIDTAVTGDEVVLLEDITLTEADCVAGADRKVLVDVANKDITLDMNGKKISVTHMDEFTNDYIVAVIRVGDGAGLTVTGNGTIEVNVLADNPDIAYMFWKRGTTGHLTILNGTFHMNDAADSMVYTNGNEIVFIKGGNWTLDAYGTRGNREPWIFNVQGAGDNHVLVTGGTFNADINRQFWSNEVIVPETHYTEVNTENINDEE